MKTMRYIALILILLAVQSTAHGQRRGNLSPGSPAPGLDVENWGTDPANIEAGNVYWVIFLPDEAIQVSDSFINIMKTVQDELSGAYSDFTIILIQRGTAVGSQSFLDSLNKLERVHWGFDRRNSSERAWMGAAGINSLFAFFIVDRKSNIQFFTGIDEAKMADHDRVLSLVLADRYDAKLMDQAARYVTPSENARKVRNYRQCHMHLDSIIELDKKIFARHMLTKFEIMLLDEKKKDEAYGYADELISEITDDPVFLMWLTEFILEDVRIDDADRDLVVAMDAAQASFEGFAKSEPAGFALMGKMHFHLGDLEKAVDFQEKAWMVARPNDKPEHWRTLIAYKDAARRLGILSSAH